MKIADEVKFGIFITLFTVSSLSFMTGMFRSQEDYTWEYVGNGKSERVYYTSNCKPESLIQYINIPYRVGCELFLKRWK